jgi:chromosome segregation ATPase
MSTDLAHRPTPEERELESKRARLVALERELTQRELDLATLRAELQTFETHYLRGVGSLYAELDEIEAQIAEALAQLNSQDPETQERAAQARAQAQERVRQQFADAEASWSTARSGRRRRYPNSLSPLTTLTPLPPPCLT